MTDYEITRDIAKKVVETVDQGLSSGLGKPVPGQMCVEAAVCFAMGLPHGDNPHCVGAAVRAYKIRLNDAQWSSNAARAAGMRRVAVAQLGSDQIDQVEFTKELTLQVTRQLLPIALRAATSLNPDHAAALETAAVSCEAITLLSQVGKVAYAAARAAAAADTAYVADTVYVADTGYVAYAAYAAADAVARAADAADAADAKKRDSILSMAAEIGVQALIKLGAKGTEWLDLCD